MPVTISGTSGVQLPLGSASAPSATNTTAQTTGVYYPTSTTLALSTNGTAALAIDASQNVGIGTSSPGRLLSLYATQPVFQITNVASGSAAGNGTIQYQVSGSTDFVLDNQGSGTGGVIRWMQAGSERMRIDTSGNLLVGTSSALANTAKVQVSGGSGSTITSETTGTGATDHVNFRNGNGKVGTITTNGTATSYNTSSDYRLKHSVAPMTTGLATVTALKPVNYKWNADDSNGEGFIAHELQEVIPQAVTGEKDAIDEDGNIKPQGVDYSKIVVHLVAAIQELKAELDALKGTVDAQAAEIAALKAKAPA